MKATAQQQVCVSCGNPLLPDGEFCLFCGDVLTSLTHPKENSPHLLHSVEATLVTKVRMEYAGFWLRVWAGAIDVTLEALAALLLTVIVDFLLKLTTPKFGLSPITVSYVTGIVFIFVLTIGAWLYSAFAESSEWRATVGKRIIGLEVLTASGGRLSFGQATVRHFMKFLSLFTATVGFMMAGWTKRRQALHDMPSDCIVVRVAEPSLSLFGKQA
jgi:uncharacterized RDD family membrane protein YckC